MNLPALPINELLACSICWGADPTSLAGANAAVGLMLVILLTVLSGFISFIIYLARRARRFAEEESVPMTTQPQN